MSYNGNPSESVSDAVRFWLQDTAADPLLSDEEIAYLVDYLGPDCGNDPLEIAAYGAEQIAAKYAGEVSINSDGVNYSGNQLQQKYRTLASSLRRNARRRLAAGAVPYVGGVKANDHPVPGTKAPNFGLGMDDIPGAGRQNYGNRGEYLDEPYEDGWL